MLRDLYHVSWKDDCLEVDRAKGRWSGSGLGFLPNKKWSLSPTWLNFGLSPTGSILCPPDPGSKQTLGWEREADIFASSTRWKKVLTSCKINQVDVNRWYFGTFCQVYLADFFTFPTGWIKWLRYLSRYPKWFSTQLNNSDWLLRANQCCDWFGKKVIAN